MSTDGQRGLLVVYTGDGKGKTTAALGAVFRALGRGLRVCVIQFIKGKWKTGERLFAETLPQLEFQTLGRGFTWESDDLSNDKRAAQHAWEEARTRVLGGGFDLVVLDEITYAINYGFIEGAAVVAALRERPAHVHVILTGRSAPEALLAVADVATEMKLLRHAYQNGVPAQPGLDY